MSMSGSESDLSTITVCKRDGVTKQPFQEEKIRKALTKAWVATQGQPDEKVINRVMNTVLASFSDTEVSVEDIQDLVETVLMKHKQFAVAKTYILYRQKQAELRGLPKLSPDPKALSDYIHAGKYARHRPEFGRREVYAETIERVEDMHIRKFPLFEGQIREAFKHVYAKHLLPSMRSMQFGGAAIEQNNARIFNCSFSHVDRMEVFAEAMYLLLAGCGTGYSVQFEHVEKLPPIPYINKDDVRHHVVQDTIEGWADAVRALTTGFLDKKYVEFSFHLVRPAGAALKTSGGRAPGHLKLKETLERMRAVLEGAQGRQLRPIECHRMLCHGADAVLSGGIRRCLPKGTLIHAERGLIPIESVTVGDKVRTSGVGHDAWSTVSDVLEQGIQTLVHVKTQMGTFKCTAKHQIAVLTSPDSYEFKMAQDLEEGDRLVFVDHIVPGKATSLPAWSYSRREADHTSTDITVPTLDKDVAWFIGYLHGNGYVHVNRTHADGGPNCVAISMNSTDASAPELARRIQDVFSRFGVASSVRTLNGENTQVVRAAGKQLALYMENFKTPNTALQVPDFILEGTAEIRAAYLAGLFDSDGAANNRPVILVASIYPEFLKQVQAVYASLGIPTRLVQNREAQGKWKAIYHLNLVGELPKVRFQSIVETFTAKTTQISLQSRMDYGYSSNWIVGSDLNYTNKWAPNSKQMTVGTFDRCGGVRKGLTPITVTDVIETDETAETFDLTVEGAHEFVAEGLLVHNSASICLFSLDDSEMLYAKTGKWYVTDPWFANANNSVVLKRDEVKKKQFKRIFKMIKEWGEPGFYFTEDFNYGTNPCFHPDTRIWTSNGYERIGDLYAKGTPNKVVVDNRIGKNDEVFDTPGVRLEDATNVFLTQRDAPVFKLTTEHGYNVTVTATHEFPTTTGRKQLKELKVGDVLYTSPDDPEYAIRVYPAIDRVAVVSIEPAGNSDVYCLTQPATNTVIVNGIVSRQCSEIGLFPLLTVTEGDLKVLESRGVKAKVGDVLSGWAFCNLCEINASRLTSLEEFLEVAKAATFIGTLQATYTDMPYLGIVTEEIARRDALLGISMTGVMGSPIALDPECQRTVALAMVEWNKEFAVLLGINQAARIGALKPAGSTSLEYGGVSSGIHPFHSRRYIRRVTADALEVIFQAFKEVNPHMCVRKPDGKWVIEFAVEAPPNAITREDLSAIEFLKIVQSTQQNWVVPSTARPEAAPGLTHNVSNTVTVKPDEWDAVCDYIWANRSFFTGVSLLASTGDKDYAFAPHEAITTPADEARWNAILASYKPVNYEDIFELGDDTNLSGEVACAGGACNV